MKCKPGMVIDVRPGESLALSGAATVELVQKSGQLARLRVIAQEEVTIQKQHARSTKVVPSMADLPTS